MELGYIYTITNKVSGKVYVGKTVNYEDRWKEHKSDLNGNRHHNSYLQRAWAKYGATAFDFAVIDTLPYEKLNEAEMAYIQQYKCHLRDYGYNMTYGGDGGRHTEDVKEVLREKAKAMWANDEIAQVLASKKQGEKHPNSVLTDVQREEIYRNVVDSPSYLAKKYNVLIGAINQTQRGTNGLCVVERINSEGFMHPKHKARLEAELAGINRVAPKKVRQVDKITGETVKVWDKTSDVKEGGFNQGNVVKCCQGKLKTHKGYKWEYAEGAE